MGYGGRWAGSKRLFGFERTADEDPGAPTGLTSLRCVKLQGASCIDEPLSSRFEALEFLLKVKTELSALVRRQEVCHLREDRLIKR